MNRFAVIGDIHGNGLLLTRILLELVGSEVSFILCVGDIAQDVPSAFLKKDQRYPQIWASQTQAILNTLSLASKPVCYVLGNHDDPCLWGSCDLATDGIVNVDSRSGGMVCQAGSVNVIGVGGSTLTPKRWPNEWSSDSVKECRYLLRSWVDSSMNILVSHTPPKGTYLDISRHHSEHLGSRAIRSIAKQLRPRPVLCVCGHVHEGRGVDIVDGIPWINAGSIELGMSSSLRFGIEGRRGACFFYVAQYADHFEVFDLNIPSHPAASATVVGRYNVANTIELNSGLHRVDLPYTDISPPKSVKRTEILTRDLGILKNDLMRVKPSEQTKDAK